MCAGPVLRNTVAPGQARAEPGAGCDLSAGGAGGYSAPDTTGSHTALGVAPPRSIVTVAFL